MRSSLLQLIPLLACSVFVAADANKVVSDFNTINSDLVKLDVDVNLVQSGVAGIGQALQVSVDSVTVDNDLIATNQDVVASSKFSASDSKNVVDAIQQVAGTANQSLADLTSKYSTFGGLSPVVLSALYQLKQDQNNLGLNLYSKLDSSQINRGVQILIGLNTAFNNAILAYGGSGMW